MTTPFDARKFVADFVQALNSKDPTRLLTYYSDRAELLDPTTPEPLRGKDAVRKNFEQWSSAFEDVKFTIKDLFESGNKVAYLFEAKARNTGMLELGPGQRVKATDKVITLEIAEFLTLDDNGKIVRDQTIFDLTSMTTQLGVTQ